MKNISKKQVNLNEAQNAKDFKGPGTRIPFFEIILKFN